MAESYLFLIVLILGLLWLVWLWSQHRPPQSHPAAVRTTLQQLLKPRTPNDCPQCRQDKTSRVVVIPTHPPIPPWSEVKSHRGRPKRIGTQGYACDNPACLSFGVSDSQVHALVGDGAHGKYERIQTFRCCETAIGTRFYPLLGSLRSLLASCQ